MPMVLVLSLSLCRGAVAEQTQREGQRSMHMAAVVVLLVNGQVLRDKHTRLKCITLQGCSGRADTA